VKEINEGIETTTQRIENVIEIAGKNKNYKNTESGFKV
jgi:hypothetical protein